MKAEWIIVKLCMNRLGMSSLSTCYNSACQPVLPSPGTFGDDFEAVYALGPITTHHRTDDVGPREGVGSRPCGGRTGRAGPRRTPDRLTTGAHRRGGRR